MTSSRLSSVVSTSIASVGAVRVGGVPLVAAAHLVGKRVDGDPVPLGVPPLGAHLRVGDEPDLEVGVRRHDDADVPSLDHRVALLAEGALALAHHLAHLRVPRDDRDGGVDHRLADLRRDVVPGDRDAAARAELDGVLAARAPTRAGTSSRSIPRRSASQVSARYMAPVSR